MKNETFTQLICGLMITVEIGAIIYLMIKEDSKKHIQESYNYQEIEALIMAKQATSSKDSIILQGKLDTIKLPVVTYRNYVYYPEFTDSGIITYHIVR